MIVDEGKDVEGEFGREVGEKVALEEWGEQREEVEKLGGCAEADETVEVCPPRRGSGERAKVDESERVVRRGTWGGWR
jgi:hypothetical protein